MEDAETRLGEAGQEQEAKERTYCRKVLVYTNVPRNKRGSR